MQSIMCEAEGFTVIDISQHQLQSGHRRNSMTPIELGKRLLVHARDGDTEEVRNLMTRGAPFTTDWLGTSPLHLAARYGHAETAEVLLRAGISRDARTKVDRTPLHIAAQEGHTSLVELLLDHGADIEAIDMLKMSPLHWAVERGHTDTVVMLIQHGANLNAISKFDKTPMHIAMDNNRPDLLDVLQNTEVQSTYCKVDSSSHFLNQLDEADSAAESLVVELSTEPIIEQQEEVETSTVSSEQGPSRSHIEVSMGEPKQVILDTGERIKLKVAKHEGSPSPSSSSPAPSLKFLQSHGISMLPADDSSLVASAMESGQTVVLTEAGKLALNLTRTGATTTRASTLNTTSFKRVITKGSMPQRKIITLTAEQLATMTGKLVTKIGSGSKKITLAPASTVKAAKTSGQSPVDVAKMTQQLEDARREADEYRQQLRKKEQEAEEYKKQLESMN